MLDQLLESLIRQLAEHHSQGEIASILNEQKLYRPDTLAPWKQFNVSRYMQEKGIQPAYKWYGLGEGKNNKNASV